MRERPNSNRALPSTRTLVLVSIGAAVAAMPIAAARVGEAQSPRTESSRAVDVVPAEGKIKGLFAVSFTVDKAVTGNNWYLVEAKARSKKRSCEYYESVQVSNAAVGQRVSVELRPFDRRRWCVGRYSGAIRYQKRISCRAPDTDENLCSDAGSVTDRFRFSVTR